MDLCPPPKLLLHELFFPISIVFSLLSLLPVSSGAANTDGSYHGTDEGEMVSMCFLCMRLKLSQREPRHSIKHKHQIAKCIISGQLDFFSSIRRHFTSHLKGFFNLKEALEHLKQLPATHEMLPCCLGCVLTAEIRLLLRILLDFICSFLQMWPLFQSDPLKNTPTAWSCHHHPLLRWFRSGDAASLKYDI